MQLGRAQQIKLLVVGTNQNFEANWDVKEDSGIVQESVQNLGAKIQPILKLGSLWEFVERQLAIGLPGASREVAHRDFAGASRDRRALTRRHRRS